MQQPEVQVNPQVLPPDPAEVAAVPQAVRPKRSAQELAEWYGYILTKATEAAEDANGVVPDHYAEELEILEQEMEGEVDACAYVKEEFEARAKAQQGTIDYYMEKVEAAREARDASLRVVEKVKTKLIAVVETQDSKSIVGAQYKARLQKGPWGVVAVEEDAPVPPAAMQIKYVTDKKALLELAKAGQAPGWEPKQSLSLRVERV